MNLEQYDRLVADVYFAGAGHQPWSVPLRKLADAMGCAHSIMHIGAFDEGHPASFCLFDDGELDRATLHDFGAMVLQGQEPRFNFAARILASGATSSQYRDSDFIEERALRRHPYYREILDPLGIRYATVNLSWIAEERMAVGLSMQRSARQGPLDQQGDRLLARIAPHFTNALKISSMSGPGGAELERVGTNDVMQGATIVDADGNVLVLSGEMEALLGAPGGLRKDGARLTSSSPQLASRLMRALRLAWKGSPSRVELDDPPVTLTAMPIDERGGAFLTGRRIGLFISDAQDAELSPVSNVAMRCGLTDAETRILALLCEGRSLREIAERRYVSVWTVRTQLKAIFDKTQTRSQRQLIAKVTRGV